MDTGGEDKTPDMSENIKRNLSKWLEMSDKGPAALADHLVYARSAISNWCSPKISTLPPARLIPEICTFFNKPIADLFADEAIPHAHITDDGLPEFKQLTWLYSLKRIQDIERTVDERSEEIWIITSTLEHDIDQGAGVEVVKKNIARGLRYIYIVDPATRHNRDKLRYSTFKGYEDRYEIMQLPEFYKYLPYNNAVIFDPQTKANSQTQMYVELPISHNKWWVLVNSEKTNRYLGYIKSLIDEYRKTHPDER